MRSDLRWTRGMAKLSGKLDRATYQKGYAECMRAQRSRAVDDMRAVKRYGVSDQCVIGVLAREKSRT